MRAVEVTLEEARDTLLSVDLLGLSYGVREILESVWIPETAHPSTSPLSGSSEGQCYVSSMALCSEIESAFAGVDAWLCRGRLLLHHEVLIDDHGWVTVLLPGGTEVIVDLTSDQAARREMPAVTLVFAAAAADGGDYCEFERRRMSEVTNQDTWLRYFLLESRFLKSLAGDLVDA